MVRYRNAGKLDHLLAELKEDIKTGRVKPLDEVINDRRLSDLAGLDFPIREVPCFC